MGGRRERGGERDRERGGREGEVGAMGGGGWWEGWLAGGEEEEGERDGRWDGWVEGGR